MAKCSLWQKIILKSQSRRYLFRFCESKILSSLLYRNNIQIEETDRNN